MLEKSKFRDSIRLPIAVVGLGVTGQSIYSLLKSAGIPNDQIATYDKRQTADFTDESLLLAQFNPKTLVVSPGVSLSQQWLKDFKKNGGTITSELSLAFQFLTSEKVIGITGSVGKSTCVSLLQAGLSAFSPNSFTGGNLGTPLASYCLDLLKGRPKAGWVILELSSYQLENFENLICHTSGLISLTANHMERYSSLDDYYNTKMTLIEKTTGPVFCNKSGGDLFDWINQSQFKLKLNATNKIKWTDRFDKELSSLNLAKSALLGLHNQDNLALATRIAIHCEWPHQAIETMKRFGGLPHRLENLGLRNGVLFVNDSKATTIQSVQTAVSSLIGSYGGTLHLLLGGKDKNLPWRDLKDLGAQQHICFYFFGECRNWAASQSNLNGTKYVTLKEAIVAAKNAAKPGDLILLSPGGTSLDEFKNFEERGVFFKNNI